MERLPAGSAKPPTRATQRLRMRLESRITMARECRKTTRKLSGGTAEQRTRAMRKLNTISATCIPRERVCPQITPRRPAGSVKAAKQGDTKAQRALKTRLSTPSKVLITIEFLGTILLLVSSYRSAGGAFGPQQRTAIVKELLGLSYLVLVCMGLFQMGVAQTNAFRFTKNLLAGMVLAMLISVIWQQSAKSVLRISGMLFVAFNLYAIAHYDVKHFAPAIRMFYLTNALLIGMAIPSAAAVWLAAKTYQEGQSRSGQAAPSQT